MYLRAKAGIALVIGWPEAQRFPFPEVLQDARTELKPPPTAPPPNAQFATSSFCA
jgi:hypothetical protein